jgi:coenzyme F420 hydrogenase subunit beta
VIDGAIVAKTEAPFSREATFVNNKEGLLKSSGALLDISPQLTEIQKFSTYTHTIPELKKYSSNKLAVVGTPCQIYTMRCMQELGVTPSQNIEICLGLFCFENFLFDKRQIEKFEKDFNIQLENIKKINIKEDLIIKFKDRKKIHIPFNHLTEYMRPACNACNNFTNIYADISFGGLGSPDKYTTVIVRTKKGKDIISGAVTAGVIKKMDLDSLRQEKMIELITQYSRLKIQRYENFTSQNLKAH